MVLNLCLAKGERSEPVMNIRAKDGVTNSAGNIVKSVQLNQQSSGIFWVQFDNSDVGQKTRNENRHLHTQGIDHAWTPVKPVTIQLFIGKNKAAQVVSFRYVPQQQKQFIEHRGY